jgi:hypothetical protein
MCRDNVLLEVEAGVTMTTLAKMSSSQNFCSSAALTLMILPRRHNEDFDLV